jgi:hypothetical protein
VSQENVEVLRAFYTAWDAGDMDALRELHDPSVIMHHPSGWPEPGPEVGRDAVMRQFHRLRDDWDADSVEPIGDFIDAAISDIYAAWLLIHTRCGGAGPALVSELDDVTDQLDGAIRNLQAAALESHALPNWQYRPVVVAKRPR